MILTLQTSTFGAYGGIPTYNRLVCKVLNEFSEGLEKVVLIATDNPSDVKPQDAELTNLSIEAFACSKAAFIQRVLGIALTRRIDLLLVGHVNYVPLALLLRRLQPELRYGLLIYGVEVWTRLSLARRRALQQADFVVSISEYTKQQAVEVNGALEDRIHLLPNALDSDAEGYASTLARRPSSIGVRLLTVCRLDKSEKYKGVDKVIEALPAVAAQVPDVRCFIIGSGTDVERHKELAKEFGVADRVHFLGFVDDVVLHEQYQMCDVFVMPSAGEGFGFVFLEAMQHGKAVVAADSGGAPEVVRDDVTGVLVQYGDVPQLAEELIRLCLDPELRARMGRAGYERLQTHFSFPRFKETLSGILKREIPAASIYTARRRALFNAGQVR